MSISIHADSLLCNSRVDYGCPTGPEFSDI